MLIYRILGYLTSVIVKLLSLTYQFKEVVGDFSSLRKHSPKGSYIVALWHQDLFPSILFGKDFSPHSTIASASKDGELITTAIKRLGYVPVRGSSKKGGTKAKSELVELLEKGLPSSLTIDGPKGPIFEIKSGIVEMAQTASVPIIPFIALGRNNWILEKSWDKMRIPKPFTKIFVYTGNPIYVPKDLNRDQYGEIKDQLKDELFKGKEILEDKIKND
jgi:lysophospholipid acyltransferase (LPLAT)-like uncharacterized protein